VKRNFDDVNEIDVSPKRTNFPKSSYMTQILLFLSMFNVCLAFPLASAQANPPTANITISYGASNIAAQHAYTGEESGATYDPSYLTVTKGTIVTWTNMDKYDHTVTSTASNTFDSDIISPGSQYSKTFEVAGTYSYYCTLHPFMSGVVAVNETTSH
jgi:plastocyanin